VTRSNDVTDPEPFELFAIRYGRHQGRHASDNFIGADPHEAGKDLEYFLWVARRSDRLLVIDTGFNPTSAAERRRTMLRLPADGVRALGIDPGQVHEVILTHLHYDHAGSLDAFPRASFHAQDAEIAYATGRCMCHAFLRRPYDVEDVVGFVRHVHANRIVFHDGFAELGPGLELRRVGGHSAGLQVVRVFTRRGWVVIASDASHFYENMQQGRPYPTVYNVADMLEGHRTVHALAQSEQHIVPGHDPLVMSFYPPPTAELDGIAVRLDVAPRDA
jgi:glyoxylase-like metal-dependent hydrolase (beta-lactamase superfamily II)